MAFAKTINMADFIKEMKKSTPEMRKEVVKATYSGVLKAEQALLEKTPVDTGALLASWRIEKNPLEPEPSVLFGNDSSYATVVMETGAKPHTVPLKPLLEWAARKLQKPIDSKEVKNLAWGVRKKIQKKGVEAKFIFSNWIDDDAIPSALEEIDKALNK